MDWDCEQLETVDEDQVRTGVPGLRQCEVWNSGPGLGLLERREARAQGHQGQAREVPFSADGGI